ncbi:MAG: hypothetical protein K8R87_13960 [Verrucomicrobia bacterium]|nr:hypothetical protein [Verrucomicrobiota bacterium]
MNSAYGILLLAVLGCAGCDQGKRKGKSGEVRPTGPVVVGKLVITPPTMDIAKGSTYDAGEGFFEQQLDILSGTETRRIAEENLKKNTPEIQPAPVVIQVARMKGSNVVNVIGRGGSVSYSGALVDAMMETYVQRVCPPETEVKASSVVDVKDAEKTLKEAERVWTAFRLEHDLTRLNAERASAERNLKRLAAASLYYEQELSMAAKLTLEQEIRRRQAAPSLPSEMPAELAALVRTTLTVAELAYLSGLRGSNVPATEAARKEAEKDRDDRVRSIRKQAEIAQDLTLAAESDIARLSSLKMESDQLQARHRAAVEGYAEQKSREKKMGGGLNDTARPVVSIIERASKAKAG